jgi:predicted enzyme related to lactoylglutathione lyase
MERMSEQAERMNATRETYPAGVPCWVDTAQPDVDAATDFYGGLFGWDFEERTPPGSDTRYLVARIRGLAVAGIGTKDNESPTAWNTYVAVESADASVGKVNAAGGSVVAEPFDVGDDGRMAVAADRSGAVFCIWEARDFAGAQLVNEPGTWSFNELNTRDRDAAIAFYGEVFGWETAPEDDGMSFWRRPGYGKFLDEINPGTLARAEEMGAPEGFPDAVGWLVTMGDDRFPPDVPPHWSTSFAVADADTTAARARELGGEVLMQPMDAPWVRFTILRDPQGATFTASQFVPPEN